MSSMLDQWDKGKGIPPQKCDRAMPPRMPCCRSSRSPSRSVMRAGWARFSASSASRSRCKTRSQTLRFVVSPLAPPLADSRFVLAQIFNLTSQLTEGNESGSKGISKQGARSRLCGCPGC